MRKRILELLRNSGGEPVSGEEISRQLEVSRTAIWKHIQTLKNEGYDIESVPKKGYILKEAPNRLFRRRFCHACKLNGWDVIFAIVIAWIPAII